MFLHVLHVLHGSLLPLQESSRSIGGELSFCIRHRAVHHDCLHSARELMRLDVCRLRRELVFLPNREIGERPLLDHAAMRDAEAPRGNGSHARNRLFARNAERPDAAVELGHRAVCARVRVVRSERPPRRAKRRVAPGNDPRTRENLVEVVFAHPEEERAGLAAVEFEDAADQLTG